MGPAGGAAAALRPGAGLQLHRVPPLKRAPQRRILGLSEHGVFQPHLSLRQPPAAEGLCGPLPPGGRGGAAGFCARPLCRGRLRPVAVRRHGPVRVSPQRRGRQRVGQLQLHALPGGGAQLPAIRRPVLAGGIPLRRPAHGCRQPADLLAGRPGPGGKPKRPGLSPGDEPGFKSAAPHGDSGGGGLHRLAGGDGACPRGRPGL